jgi:MFS family permease
MATVTGWFDRHRSLAVSLVSAGMGVAPLTVAPIAAVLVSTYDRRFAQLLIGLSVWVLLLPAAFLVRRAPGLVGNDAERCADEPQMTVRTALTSPQFAVLALMTPLILRWHRTFVRRGVGRRASGRTAR